MNFLADWKPGEWKQFANDYNKRLEQVLKSKDLFDKFGLIVAEQIAIVEEGGGNSEIVHTRENYGEIILRTEFV